MTTIFMLTGEGESLEEASAQAREKVIEALRSIPRSDAGPPVTVQTTFRVTPRLDLSPRFHVLSTVTVEGWEESAPDTLSTERDGWMRRNAFYAAPARGLP